MVYKRCAPFYLFLVVSHYPLPLSDEVERFKTDNIQRYYVIDDNERLDFIPALFFTPTADNMTSQLVTPAFRL